MTLPATPVTVPAGAYFCWPLRLDVAGARLDWATAQPVCTVDVDGRTVLVLAATDGIAPELALDAGTVASVGAPSGDIAEVGGRILVTGLRPGTGALVEVEAADGGRAGLLVLDAATARTVHRGVAWGAERLVLSADGIVFDCDEVRVHGAAGRTSFAVLPAPHSPLVVDGETVTAEADGVLARYRVGSGGDEPLRASLTLVRPPGPAPEPATCVLGRASAPADKYYDTVAAEYRVDVPDDLPEGAVLRLHWSGDAGRAHVGERLVADQFFSGRVWDIGRLAAGAALRVRVLPLHADARVHVPREAADAARSAVVRRAEWILGRVRAVRAG